MSTSPRRMLMAGALCAATLSLVLTGCSTNATHSSTQQQVAAKPLVISDARINAPVLTTETGAFATITNNGSTDVKLVSVSVPMADAMSASVHTMSMMNGKMAMTPVKGGLVIKAGSMLMLKPGGYHIMLMSPHVMAGQSVPMTFTFSNGSKVTVQAMVMKAASPSPTSSMKMKM